MVRGHLPLLQALLVFISLLRMLQAQALKSTLNKNNASSARSLFPLPRAGYTACSQSIPWSSKAARQGEVYTIGDCQEQTVKTVLLSPKAMPLLKLPFSPVHKKLLWDQGKG